MENCFGPHVTGANVTAVLWIAECQALKTLTLRGFKAITMADEAFLRTLTQKVATLQRFKLVGSIRIPIAINKKLGFPRHPEKRLATMRQAVRPLEDYCKEGMDLGEWKNLACEYTHAVGVALLKTKIMCRWRNLIVSEAKKEKLILDFAEFDVIL